VTKKIRIRASSLPTYADCMARGIAGTLRKLVASQGYTLNQRGRTVGATVGTACHAGVSMDLQAILDGRDRPTSRQVEALSVATLQAGTSVDDAPMVYDDLTPNPPEAVRQVLAITRTHYQRVAPVSHPILVEQRLFCHIGDKVVLTGQPDNIDRTPSGSTVRDLKTGRRSNHVLQLGGYGLLADSNGIEVDDAEIVGIPRPKKGRPVDIYTDTISKEILHHGAIPAVLDLVEQITENVDRVMAGDPIYQVNPASTLCSRKFCPAHGTAFCVATYKR